MPLNEPTVVSDVERRRRLVVVRAGDSSLHPTWLQGPDSPEFDLVVSYYGDDPARYRSDVENRIDHKGGKWDGLAALFASRPDLLDSYDYFWLPDDDIAADTRTINGIFAAMAAHTSNWRSRACRWTVITPTSPICAAGALRCAIRRRSRSWRPASAPRCCGGCCRWWPVRPAAGDSIPCGRG